MNWLKCNLHKHIKLLVILRFLFSQAVIVLGVQSDKDFIKKYSSWMLPGDFGQCWSHHRWRILMHRLSGDNVHQRSIRMESIFKWMNAYIESLANFTAFKLIILDMGHAFFMICLNAFYFIFRLKLRSGLHETHCLDTVALSRLMLPHIRVNYHFFLRLSIILWNPYH